MDCKVTGRVYLGSGSKTVRSSRRRAPYIPVRIKSATRTPIIMAVTLVLARTQSGMMEASTTRKPSIP